MPPGELHAIGAGVFRLELQQPEDLSILLEWNGFALDGERDGHLGVGFEVALSAVNVRGRAVRELNAAGSRSLFTADADAYFRLSRVVVEGDSTVDEGFAIIVVTEGEVVVGDGLRMPRGTTAVFPAAVGPIRMRGDGVVLVCRPPAV